MKASLAIKVENFPLLSQESAMKTCIFPRNLVIGAWLLLTLVATGCHDEAKLVAGSPGDTLEGPAHLTAALPIDNGKRGIRT
jgi:hypothetical protein